MKSVSLHIFLVNQTHKTQCDSQTNDSYEPVLFSESKHNSATSLLPLRLRKIL